MGRDFCCTDRSKARGIQIPRDSEVVDPKDHVDGNAIWQY